MTSSPGAAEVRFYSTNRADDPGFVLTTAEVARRFWASEDAADWIADPGLRLERVALLWVTESIGQWEDLRRDWTAIYDAIVDLREGGEAR